MSSLFQGRHVLLVEDSAIIAMGQEIVLRDLGFVTTTVYRGEDAVQFVREHETVDIVLMDIDLGEKMDGLGAARRIRAFRDVPVLFLAAQRDPQIVEQALSISTYGYVQKGSGDFVLQEAIRMAFELARIRSQLRRERDLDARPEQ